MRNKWGKFFADWRSIDGRRHTKAFCTISEALDWKEAHRRPCKKGPKRTHQQRLRGAHRARDRHYLHEYMRELQIREHVRKQFAALGGRKSGLHITTTGRLQHPIWKYISRTGRPRMETLESPEHMAARLGLTCAPTPSASGSPCASA